MDNKNETTALYAGYDQFAQQYEAAYRAFAATYELRTPKPIMPRHRLTNAGVLVALGVMLIAQVIVSGSRTIREFGDVGYPAFVMLELGMVVFAFIRTSRSYANSNARRASVAWWINAGLVLSFAVLLSGNIDAALSSKGIELPGAVNVIIQLAIAISAPVLAFITGDVFGMYAAMATHERRAETERYQAEARVWSEGMARSWQSQKAQWGVKIEVVREPVRVGHALPDNVSAVRPVDEIMDSGRTSGQGYTKRMDARTQVWTWLDANPSDAVLNVRELADKIGVGKSTVASTLREWRQSQEVQS